MNVTSEVIPGGFHSVAGRVSAACRINEARPWAVMVASLTAF